MYITYIHFLTTILGIDSFNTVLVLAGQQLLDHYSRRIYQSCNETKEQQHQQHGKVNDLLLLMLMLGCSANAGALGVF